IWKKWPFYVVIAAIFILPLLCVLERPVVAVADAEGRLDPEHWWPAWGYAELSRVDMTVVINALLCCVNAVLETSTFITYHRMNVARQRRSHEDFRLLSMHRWHAKTFMILVYSMLELALQVLGIGYYAAFAFRLYETEFFMISIAYQRYVIVVETLMGPICLFTTSRSLRKEYLKFFGIADLGEVRVTSVDTLRLEELEHSSIVPFNRQPITWAKRRASKIFMLKRLSWPF
ncbi:hypothetical protein AAVH_31050, partial [Aphelenchoides avenae]